MSNKVPKHNRMREGRIKNKPYMIEVSKEPCMICGRHDVQPHHPINSKKFKESRGKFGKAHDTEVVPLCCAHHKELHDDFGNEQEFEDHYNIDFKEKIEYLNNQYLT